MHSYAQTNIQLFNQLHRRGYGAADLEAVVSAYELMISLMTGRFRASGKTFIAHLVGTASILGSLQVPSPLVAAGLLHAVYSAGDFGDERPGISDAKRERVRSVVGEQVEEYVCRYHTLSWTDRTIRSVSRGLESMAAIERDVVLMRLANELEEFLDLGIQYCGEQRRLGTSGNYRCRLMVEIAQKLGFPSLSEELVRTIDESASTPLPPELLRPHARNSSFLLAPQSYQRLKDSLASRLATLQGTAHKPSK
jgi:(p)ppGpp synthase/HD superfamily hydrolase